MIWLLPLICLTGCQLVFKLEDRDAAPPGRTIEYVQSKSKTMNGLSTLAVTLDEPVEMGDLIVVTVGTFQNDLAVVSDSAGNQYTEPNTAISTPANGILHALFTRSVVAVERLMVIANCVEPGIGTPEITLAVHAYRGTDPDDPFDQKQSQTGGPSTLATSGTVTVAVDGGLYFGVMTHDQTVNSSAGAGFTKRELPTDNADNVPMITADRIGTAGPVEATFEMDAPAPWACQLLTFQ